jgi:hypothetical protein
MRLRYCSGLYSNIGRYFQNETNSQVFKINYVTPWNRVFIDKLRVVYLANKLPSSHLA